MPGNRFRRGYAVSGPVANRRIPWTVVGRIMERQDIDSFRSLLTNQLEELLRQSDDTVSGMSSRKESFPDPTDRVGLEADRDFMHRIRDREHKLIEKIREALGRIKDNTFGVCEKCGSTMSVKLMRFNPIRARCIECTIGEKANPINKKADLPDDIA